MANAKRTKRIMRWRERKAIVQGYGKVRELARGIIYFLSLLLRSQIKFRYTFS